MARTLSKDKKNSRQSVLLISELMSRQRCTSHYNRCFILFQFSYTHPN